MCQNSLALKAEPAAYANAGKYGALQQKVEGDLERVCRSLFAGNLTTQEWYDKFSLALLDGHAEAWALGRGLTGDTSPLGMSDYLVGRAVMDGESDFLLPFLEDLGAERYGGPGDWKDRQVLARSRMYAGKLRGTANRALVETSDLKELWEWRMTAFEHCEECPRIESMNPWYGDELAQVPGDGGTPCLTNCKCVLVRRSDRLRGFMPVA